jgi:hypothetical protein
MIHWHASKDGLKIYADGTLILTIPARQFAALIYDMARVMR